MFASFPSAVTLRMLYGYEATVKGSEDRDPLVALAKRTTEEFSDSSIAGRWLVDSLPLRKPFTLERSTGNFLLTNEPMK